MGIKRYLLVSCLFLIVLLFYSCSIESAFPDDNLDNYWRLDKVEYNDGVNFFGDTCQYEDIDNTMFGFARHIVIIEDLAREFERHGITTRYGDSLKMDFSIYADDNIINSLRYCGLDSVVTIFKVKYPSKKRMILTSKKATLHFRMW